MTRMPTLRTQLLAEVFGTAALLAVIVGSGIIVSHDGTTGIAALFPHAVAIGVALGVLILLLRPISGAQFNPAVTLCAVALGLITPRHAVLYIVAQTVGALIGVIGMDRLMRATPLTLAVTERAGRSMFLSEILATTLLLTVIFLLVRRGELAMLPVAVGGYILAAIMFTPSTAFANPAVTVARMFTDTYTGIAPGSVPAFLRAQLLAIPLAIGIVTLFDHTDYPRQNQKENG